MVNLFSTHFDCGHTGRQKELDYCLKVNQKNPLIDRVYKFANRPTFHQFFEQTRKLPVEDINILANADIYFDDSLRYVVNIGPRDCYALTRWEIDEEYNVVSFKDMHAYNKEAKPQHSQDVWIFRGPVMKNVMGHFHIGQPGCDNRIAYEIFRGGYRITNPSLTIKAIHKHKEKERNYTIPNRVSGPYKWVHQTTIL